MTKLYSRNDDSNSAFLVTKGELAVEFSDKNKATFPADNIIVGTIEYFLESVSKEKIPRIFSLSLSADGEATQISLETVEEMMGQFKFGSNTNIFLARLIEYATNNLIKKSKTPLGFLRRYQRRAGSYARTVDLIFDMGIRRNIPEVINLAKEKKKLEVYKDGSLNPHFQSIEAIRSPGKDRSEYVKFFKKNTLICHEGATGRELYILLNGSVNVTCDNLYVASISTPGEAFGEMSLFLNYKRTASLVANEDSNLYVIPYAKIAQFAKTKCPDLFFKIAQKLSLRLVDTLQRMIRIDNLINKSNIVKHENLAKDDLQELVEDHIAALEKEIKNLCKDPKIALYLSKYSQITD